MEIIGLFLCCLLIYGTRSMSIVEVIEPEKPVCDLVITKDGYEIERNGVATGFGGDTNRIYCDAQCTGPGASPALRWYKGRRAIKTYRRRVYSVKTTFDRTIILNIRNMLEKDVGEYTCRGWLNTIGWVEKTINLQYGCRHPMMICDATRCLSPEYICDGIAQCDDEYDELFCSQDTCNENEIACDGGCLSKNMTCDGYVDCIDGADENDCGCSDDEFECVSGECLPLDNVCDKTADCADNSDETGCPCLESEFDCGNGACLNIDDKCNGVVQCTNGADEENCPCEEFTCDDGQCVEEGAKCNGVEECADGSDEIDCPCISQDLTCDDGQCIEEGSRCDGIEQCADGSDELQCRTSTSTQPTTESSDFYEYGLECDRDEFTCDNGQCIEQDGECDGVVQCTDESDELNCGCAENAEFQCVSDKLCIPLIWVCDGVGDCIDQSDEVNCVTSTKQPSTVSPDESEDTSAKKASVSVTSTKQPSTVSPDESEGTSTTKAPVSVTNTKQPSTVSPDGSEGTSTTKAPVPGCSKDHFECSDGQCIDKELVCNSIPDCSNQADEKNCGFTCNESENLCDGNVCYSEVKKCDGKFDCKDKSDEKNCPVTATEKPKEDNNDGDTEPVYTAGEMAFLTSELYEESP